jgi:hypothetical protein
MFWMITTRRRWVWIAIFLAVVFAFLAVVTYLPRLSFVVPTAGLTAAERAKAQGDFRGHLLQAFAGLVLIVGAYFTGRTFALNREGQITERFTRAVEQLANDEKLDVRLGGIYALERIARDSATHYEPVVEVLTAFLREHAHRRPKESRPHRWLRPKAGEPAEVIQLPADHQAAATVLGRRDRGRERPDYRLDLRRVDLRSAILTEADLENTLFNGANLESVRFNGAHLALAVFTAACLKKAWIIGAHLEGANFSRAHLEGAHLDGANLTGAFLRGAFLEGADLSQTTGVTQEQLEGAFTDIATTFPEGISPRGRRHQAGT